MPRHTFRFSDNGCLVEDLDRHGAHSIAHRISFKVYHLFEGNILVVDAEFRFCRRSENWRRKTRTLNQAVGERNPANAFHFLILCPTRSREISPHNALNSKRPRFFHEHAAPPECIRIRLTFGGVIIHIRRHKVIFDDTFRLLKPVCRNLRKHFPFVGNALRHDDVVGRKPVGRNDEQMLPYFIHIADFTALNEVEIRKICLGND